MYDEKNVYSAVFGYNVLYINIKSNWSIIPFKTNTALLIFCLDYLSIDVSGTLNSPTIIVFLSLSLLMSVNIHFIL